MTFLSFSLAFCLLVVLHVILNSKFKLCAFVLSMLLIKGGIEKSNGQYLGLIYDEKLTYLGLNLNSEILVVLPYYMFHVEKRVCLSCDV
jgi:hypothetical protein